MKEVEDKISKEEVDEVRKRMEILAKNGLLVVGDVEFFVRELEYQSILKKKEGVK